MAMSPLDRVLTCSSLPTLPGVALQVLELTRDPQVSIAKIASAVQNDPALTARVLKTVNSSYYGLPSPCPSISRAMGLLGLNTVKSIVLSFSLVDTTKKMGLDDRFDLEAFWRRAIYGAAGARAVALATKACDPDEVFVGALLQDIGVLACFAALKDEYVRLQATAGPDHESICQIERSALGADHAEVGGRLGERWRLPPAFLECVRYHHSPLAAGPANATMVRAVHLGSVLASVLSHPEPKPKLGALIVRGREWFSLDNDVSRALVEETAKGAKELSKLLEMSTGQPPDLGHILSEAHEQLAQVQEAAAQESFSLRMNNERLSREATTDALTGLFNRAHFDVALRDAVASCRAGNRPIAVIFFDADKFKSVNDTHGHQAGDAVLRETGKRLSAALQGRGTLCRYGGEEFVLILPDATAEQARVLAEQMREVIAGTPFDLSAQGLPGLVLNRTISGGVAASEPGTPTAAWTGEEITKHADEAVYAAKQAGRNRVCCHSASPAKPESTSKHRLGVLVIDDDPFVLKVLERVFAKRTDMHAAFAGSVEEALRTLRASGGSMPEVVIVDYHMPGTSGPDLVRALRANKSGSRIRVAMMSGDTDELIRTSSISAGADAFFDKIEFTTNPVPTLDRLAQMTVAKVA